jgi:hypothetical protein
MTPKTRNILIGSGALVVLFLIGRYLYRKSRTPEKLNLDVTNIDDAKKSFDYVVKKEDGSVLTSGKYNVRDLDVVFVDGKNRVTISPDYKKEGALITGKSLKETQFLKKIAFKKEGDALNQLATAISSTTQNTNTTNTEQ